MWSATTGEEDKGNLEVVEKSISGWKIPMLKNSRDLEKSEVLQFYKQAEVARPSVRERETMPKAEPAAKRQKGATKGSGGSGKGRKGK